MTDASVGESAEVAAVVVAGGRGELERAVGELRGPQGVDLEIVVVEDGAGGGWLWSAWARGVAASSAPYVLLVTPGTSVPAGTVGVLRDALEADPGAAVAGPCLVDERGFDLGNGEPGFPTVASTVLSALGLPARLRPARRPGASRRPGAGPARVAFVRGDCMLVRRRALAAIGGLDERFPPAWGEVDLARRLLDAGYHTLLVSAATAVRPGERAARRRPLRDRAEVGPIRAGI